MNILEKVKATFTKSKGVKNEKLTPKLKEFTRTTPDNPSLFQQLYALTHTKGLTTKDEQAIETLTNEIETKKLLVEYSSEKRRFVPLNPLSCIFTQSEDLKNVGVWRHTFAPNEKKELLEACKELAYAQPISILHKEKLFKGLFELNQSNRIQDWLNIAYSIKHHEWCDLSENYKIVVQWLNGNMPFTDKEKDMNYVITTLEKFQELNTLHRKYRSSYLKDPEGKEYTND